MKYQLSHVNETKEGLDGEEDELTMPNGRETVAVLPFIFAVDGMSLVLVAVLDEIWVWLSTDVRSPDVDDPGVDDLAGSMLESISQVVIL